MNWIILIIAGLFESGFTFCLGKAKETSGTEHALWLAGFFISLALSMILLAKAVQKLPIGTHIRYGQVSEQSERWYSE